MTVHADPLVDDYLRRLAAAASVLPPHRRDELISEIRDHLQEALRQAPADDEAAVRNMLERLGPPEEIVSAATEPTSPGQLAAPFRETSSSAIASLLLGVLWLGGAGSVLALVFGYHARRAIKNSAGTQKGSGLAAAGIILGWIGVAMLLTAALAAAALLAASAGSSSSGTPIRVTTP